MTEHPKKTAGRLTAGAAVALLAMLAAAGWYLFTAAGPARGSSTLRISAGDASGLRHQFAQLLADQTPAHRVTLVVQPTAGSEAALDAVQSGQLDLAFVQGGLGSGGRSRIRQVTALHVEPLHFIVKRELADELARDLSALRGRSVNVSQPGSGTYALSTAVLEFADLRADDIQINTLSYGKLMSEADRTQLPDALFAVSSMPAPVASHMVQHMGYTLAPLPFGEAFALDGLTRGMSAAAGAPASAPAEERIDRSHVYDTVIPPFTYDVQPPSPAVPVRTLGTRLLLVAGEHVDPEAVERVLHAIFTSAFGSQISKPPLDTAVLSLPPEFPLHRGAALYMKRSKPLIAADFYDWLEKTINIAAIAATAIFSLWLWLRRRWQRSRDLGFAGYVERVAAVERRALELELASQMDLAELLALQRDLSRLKLEALERMTAGELQGEELMAGFLAQVNDARTYLTRLILHERDNLEQQAQAGGRSARELWEDATRAAGGNQTAADSPPRTS